MITIVFFLCKKDDDNSWKDESCDNEVKISHYLSCAKR